MIVHNAWEARFVHTIRYEPCKADVSKEGPNFCWDAPFLDPFLKFESVACCCKKGFKNSAS